MNASPRPPEVSFLHNRVARRSAMFVVAISAQNLGAFAFLAVLIATLDPANFTRFGLFSSALAVGVPVASLNIHLSAARLYFDHETDADRARLLASTFYGALALGGLVLAAVVAGLALMPWTNPITGGLLRDDVGIALVALTVIVSQFADGYCRITGRPGLLTALGISRWAVLIGAYVMMDRWVGSSVSTVIAAYLLAHSATGLLLLGTRLRRALAHAPSRALAGRGLHYAWPTAVNSASAWTINASGRWIGAAVMPLAMLAPYTLATQFVLLVSSFVRAIVDAQLPETGEAFARGDIARGRSIVNKASLGAAALVAAAYGALALLLYGLGLPLPAGYVPSASVLGIALLASLLDVAQIRGTHVLLQTKRTRASMGATVVGGAVAIATSFALVGPWGDRGLIGALCLGIVVQALIVTALARRAA